MTPPSTGIINPILMVVTSVNYNASVVICCTSWSVIESYDVGVVIMINKFYITGHKSQLASHYWSKREEVLLISSLH